MTMMKPFKAKLALALAAALILSLTMTGALAQPIYFPDVVPSITAVAQDGSEIIVQSRTFQLLGRDEEDNALIFIGGQYLTVAADELTAIIPDLDMSALRSISDYPPIIKGRNGETARALQAALETLGYLEEGSADGQFGSKTETAIQMLQTDLGLEPTEEFDPYLQLLILSMGEETYNVEIVDPRTLYAPIAARTTANLEAVYDSGLVLEYDDISGEGLISDGATYEFDMSGESDIEQYVFTLRVGMYISETETGEVTVEPAVLIDCLCARRPMMTGVILKAGDARVSAEVGELTGTLEGARSVEHTVVRLGQDGAALLAGAEEAGELRIRVTGRYQTFDITFPAESLAGISLTGRVAQTL